MLTRHRRGRTCTSSENRAVTFFGWVFFLISLGGQAPHLLRAHMWALRTCGGTNDIELTIRVLTGYFTALCRGQVPNLAPLTQCRSSARLDSRIMLPYFWLQVPPGRGGAQPKVQRNPYHLQHYRVRNPHHLQHYRARTMKIITRCFSCFSASSRNQRGGLYKGTPTLSLFPRTASSCT